jgi:hypothetical protein
MSSHVFSTIFLEESDEYLVDCSATFTFLDSDKQQQPINGRLRISTKHCIFEPSFVNNSTNIWLLRIPIYKMKELCVSRGGFLKISCEKSDVVNLKFVSSSKKFRCTEPYNTNFKKQSFLAEIRDDLASEVVPLLQDILKIFQEKPRTEHLDCLKILSEKFLSKRVVSFDLGSLDTSHRVRPLLEPASGLRVRRVKPLVQHWGILQLSSEFLYFQAHPNYTSKPVKKLAVGQIVVVFPRWFSVDTPALELVVKNKSKGLYLLFENLKDRDLVLNKVGSLGVCQWNHRNHSIVTKLWQVGEIGGTRLLRSFRV